MNISFVDDEAPANPYEEVVTKLLEHILEEVKLECHLSALAISQHKVRIIAVGTNVNDLVRGTGNQFNAGIYSETLHRVTDLWLQIYTILLKV